MRWTWIGPPLVLKYSTHTWYRGRGGGYIDYQFTLLSSTCFVLHVRYLVIIFSAMGDEESPEALASLSVIG